MPCEPCDATLLRVTTADAEEHADLLDQCSRLVCDQWPRGNTAASFRARLVHSGPTGSLPCSYLLVHEGRCVGHARLTDCFESSGGSAAAVTFVVVDPERRGEGMGAFSHRPWP